MNLQELFDYWTKQVPLTVDSTKTNLLVETDYTKHNVTGIRLGNSPDGEPALILDIR